MNTLTILGLQWGDEGKGKIVDGLAGEAQHVARYQGGHNAGHTLINNGKKTVLHLLPSGMMHPHPDCYIGNGVVVSLPDLRNEIEQLQADGIRADGRLFVARNAALVLPYHIRLDEAREQQRKIGTTLRGIGPAHEDKTARRALRIYDLYNGEGRAKFDDNVDYYNHLLAYHHAPPLAADALWDDLQADADALRDFFTDDIPRRLASAEANGENILLEGAQGSLLDIEQGTYPYTTAAGCLATAVAPGLGVQLQTAPLGVIKAYNTRVGNGYFPTELRDEDGARLAKNGNECGATTGRARRCGWLDAPMLRHALRVNGCRRLVLTKLDVFDGWDAVKICVGYRLEGEALDYPPADPAALQLCEPVYETFPGWRGDAVLNRTDEAALPTAARDFIAALEAMVNARVDLISTGADRKATIIRRPPFDSDITEDSDDD